MQSECRWCESCCIPTAVSKWSPAKNEWTAGNAILSHKSKRPLSAGCYSWGLFLTSNKSSTGRVNLTSKSSLCNVRLPMPFSSDSVSFKSGSRIWTDSCFACTWALSNLLSIQQQTFTRGERLFFCPPWVSSRERWPDESLRFVGRLWLSSVHPA